MLCYFLFKDIDAFVLFLIMPPAIGSLLFFAIKGGAVILPLFFFFSFTAVAITPAFFFMNRGDYSYSGFTAIKDFNFDLYEFFTIYSYLFYLLVLILVFTSVLNRVFRVKNAKKSNNKLSKEFRTNGTEKKGFISLVGQKKYSSYIVVFIVVVLLPLNIFMYTSGIGISTVEPPALPYKIVGITFYFRNYIAPLMVGYLYLKSERKLGVVLVVLLYALTVGILSLSKASIVLICLPVILLAYFDQKIIRVAAVGFYMLLLYGLVSWARQFVFLANVGSIEMIRLAIDNIAFDMLGDVFNFFSVVEAISTRLYGANVFVLVHQFDLANNFSEAFNYYLGRGDGLADIIFYDVFELKAVEGVTIGVGVGYLGTILLLANKSFLLLTALAMVTAVLLTTSELIVKKCVESNSVFAPAGYGVGFMMVLTLFDGDIRKFYYVVVIAILGIFFLNYKRNMTSLFGHCRVKH